MSWLTGDKDNAPPKLSSERCSSCGGPRNHYVNGKLLARCAKCNDAAAAKAGGRSTVVDCPVSSEAAELIDQIDALLDTEEYAWAEDTLSGIRETVERTGKATDAQQRAVSNIASSVRGDR